MFPAPIGISNSSRAQRKGARLPAVPFAPCWLPPARLSPEKDQISSDPASRPSVLEFASCRGDADEETGGPITSGADCARSSMGGTQMSALGFSSIRTLEKTRLNH